MRTETKPAVEAAPEPARGLATDGLGLASMIRNDSLNNLSTLAEQDSPRPPNDEPTAAAHSPRRACAHFKHGERDGRT